MFNTQVKEVTRSIGSQDEGPFFIVGFSRGFSVSRSSLGLMLLTLLLASCSSTQVTEVLEPGQSTLSSREEDIDTALQQAAIEALAGREGTLIVMDPQNGRLRAVVNPRLAFEQAFPPGSAIKPFIALSALRGGVLDAETRSLCRGRYARDGFEIVCSHPRDPSPFTAPKALAYSCNHYFATLAERLSPSRFDATLASFRFGLQTGVNQGRESCGRLPQGDWGPHIALGEDSQFRVTPIQLLLAYSALVNGGYLHHPQPVMGPGVEVGRVTSLYIASEHRKLIIEGMRGAVRYGTAAGAKLGSMPRYVFGKTGTSTASNGFRTQGWFVGFEAAHRVEAVPPPEEIKLAVLVFLKRAHGAECAGVARSVFEAYARRHERSVFVTQSDCTQMPNPLPVRVRLMRQQVTQEIVLEDYVGGVLAAEASVEDEFEGLKAQAVVSRTYALKNLGRHSADGYDLCSTTHCQRYTAVASLSCSPPSHNLFPSAVLETEGQVLLDEDRHPGNVYFHAACGGMTADMEGLWGVPAPSFLHAIRDDYCAAVPGRFWTESIVGLRLREALSRDSRSDVGARLDDVIVTQRDASGRAMWIALEGERRRFVRGWDFKLIVGRGLGWNFLKSSRFEVRRAGDAFLFRGSGFGHGLGLCQQGAHVMARRGASFQMILEHYFPGAEIGRAETNGNKVLSPVSALSLGLMDAPSPPTPEGMKKLNHAPSPGLRPPSPPLGARELALFFSFPSPPFGGEGPGVRGQRDLVRRHFFRSPSLPQQGRGDSNPLGPLLTMVGFKQHLSGEYFRIFYSNGTSQQEAETVLRILELAQHELRRRVEAATISFVEKARAVDLVIHDSTQEFVAVTGKPWWVAATTRNLQVDLQPVGVLMRRGILATTVRHEYSHAVIEALAGAPVPLWLAEGLAVYVSGEGALLKDLKPAPRLTLAELEKRLAYPSSAQEMRLLYTQAHERVLEKIRQEGEAAFWRKLAGATLPMGER